MVYRIYLPFLPEIYYLCRFFAKVEEITSLKRTLEENKELVTELRRQVDEDKVKYKTRSLLYR